MKTRDIIIICAAAFLVWLTIAAWTDYRQKELRQEQCEEVCKYNSDGDTSVTYCCPDHVVCGWWHVVHTIGRER